jgi:hypothetical protein
LSTVDLPAPVAPTSATVSPGFASKRESRMAGASGVVEGDVFETHMAAQVFRAEALGEVGFIRRVDDLEDAFGGDDAAGEGAKAG